MALLDVLGAIASPLASGISAISSLVGGNKQADAQREANEQNYKMFREQLGFTKDMYEDAKAYNTPKNQRARYEDADLNPYLMMGQVDAGNAVAQTASSGNAMQPVTAQGQSIQNAGLQLAQGVQSAIPALQQVMSNKEAVKASMIENAFRASRLQNELVSQRVDIEKKLADKGLSEQERNNLVSELDEINERVNQIRIYNKYLDKRLSTENEKLENEVDLAYYEAEYKRELARYQKACADILPKYQQAQINALLSQASQALSSSRLFDAQRDTEDLLRDERLRGEINSNIEKAARSNGITLDNQQKKALMPYVVQQAQNEADAVKVGPIEIKGNSFRRFVNRVGQGTPASRSNYRLNTHMGKPLGK